MTKLNLGCGQKKLEGYINCDINPYFSPDACFNAAKKWPFESETADEILMDNIVEHIDGGILDWLKEAKRVLKANGKLHIVCPNCFHWKTRLRYLFGVFGANSGYAYDHRWLFKPSFLKSILEYNGFEVSKTSDLFDQEINIIARKRA